MLLEFIVPKFMLCSHGYILLYLYVVCEFHLSKNLIYSKEEVMNVSPYFPLCPGFYVQH